MPTSTRVAKNKKDHTLGAGRRLNPTGYTKNARPGPFEKVGYFACSIGNPQSMCFFFGGAFKAVLTVEIQNAHLAKAVFFSEV